MAKTNAPTSENVIIGNNNKSDFDEQDIKKSTVLRVFQVLGCMKKLI